MSKFEGWLKERLKAIIVWLDRRAARRVLLALPKCRKCGRHVKSPCHDAGGYHEEGPWDTLCHDEFGRNFY